MSETATNRFEGIEVYPTKSKTVGVYAGYRGSKSTQVCDTTVDLHGLTFPVTIWARLGQNPETGEETLTTEPSLPKGMKIDDDDARDEFKSIVLMSAEVWVGYSAAYEKAKQRLINPIATANAASSRKVEVIVRQK